MIAKAMVCCEWGRWLKTKNRKTKPISHNWLFYNVIVRLVPMLIPGARARQRAPGETQAVTLARHPG